MALKLQDKFAAFRVANERYRAALDDLIDPTTGEAILAGGCVFDEELQTLFQNSAGKLVRTKVQVIPSPKVAS